MAAETTGPGLPMTVSVYAHHYYLINSIFLDSQNYLSLGDNYVVMVLCVSPVETQYGSNMEEYDENYMCKALAMCWVLC